MRNKICLCAYYSAYLFGVIAGSFAITAIKRNDQYVFPKPFYFTQQVKANAVARFFVVYQFLLLYMH